MTQAAANETSAAPIGDRRRLVAWSINESIASADAETPTGKACVERMEAFADSLFPRNRWIEAEAWIIELATIFGVKTPQMEAEVSSYEVGRASAAQLALSQASSWPECR